MATGVTEERRSTFTRRVTVVFAVLAMLLVVVATAAPAMARHYNDGRWDNCNWVFLPWWG